MSSRKKIKVVMLGEGRVGKTSLLHRFMNGSFDEECPSTQKATMYANAKMEVNGGVVDVAVWDTAGQERYHALGPIYYRDAHGAVLVYDITDKDSFAKVRVWLRELHQVVGDSIQVVVVGNKCDLERDRKVKKEEAEQWCLENGCPHFLCSAKLGLKVSDVYQTLVSNIVKGLAGGTPSGDAAGPPSSSLGTVSRGRGLKVSLEEPAPKPAQDKESGCPC
jgi:small GTP-binding protein